VSRAAASCLVVAAALFSGVPVGRPSHTHDPDRSVVEKVVADACNYYPKVRTAAEGMEIEL